MPIGFKMKSNMPLEPIYHLCKLAIFQALPFLAEIPTKKNN